MTGQKHSNGPSFRARALPALGRAAFSTFVGLIVIFILAPIVVVLAASVSPTQYLSFPPKGFTLKWFTDISALGHYMGAFQYSFMMAAMVTVLSLILGLWIALLLARKDTPARATMMAFFMSPIILPELALALGLLQYFSHLGVVRGTVPILLAHVVVCTPYVVRTVHATAIRLDPNISDSAISLGATPMRVLWDVTLPTLRPALLSSGIMAFIMSFDNVTIAMMLSAPGATTLPALLFNQAAETGLSTTIAAVCALLTLFMFGLMVLVERLVGLEHFAGSALAGKDKK